MKKLVLVIASLLLSVAVMSASPQQGAAVQTPPDQAAQAPDQMRQRLDQIKERLALTPEQVEQIRPILQEEGQKLKALRDKRDDGGGSRRDRRKMGRELRDIQRSTDEQLQKILSKDQMSELKKMREEWRQQVRERRSA